MPNWYSPDDAWPSHPNKVWRESLDFARDHGWYFVKSDSHSFGTVRCNPPTEQGGCVLVVYSTGRSTENVAKDLKKLVRKCRHQTGKDTTPLQRAEERLRGATTLVDAAERRLRRDRIAEEVEARFHTAEQLLADAEAALDQVEKAAALDESNRAGDGDLADAASGLGLTADPLPTAAEFVDAGEKQVADAEAELAGAPNGARRRALVSQAASLRARIDLIRRQIDLG